MLPENAASLLTLACSNLLGKAERGSMAFIRCLPPEVTRGLAADLRFALNDWQVAAVVDTKDESKRWITADEAVEWRENKAAPTLLLIDANSAGAGMDGIYSAAREISETDLFSVALEIARQDLPHGFKGYAKSALAKAKMISGQRSLAPWQAFSYLCRAVLRPDDLGGALPLIGLWPVLIGDKPDEGDLDKAASLTERMFPLHRATRLSPEQRVIALKLVQENVDIEHQLSRFIREVDSLPRLQALALVEGKSEFWLNRLHPGLFDEQTLQSIKWINWRGKTGKPQAWSGLQENEDKRLEFRLNPNANKPKERARMEVRWETIPDTLAKGTVEYVVEIRSEQEVLAEKSVSHTGKSQQKVVFTQDDFEDIGENARFEPQVFIRSLGENICEVESEDFLLCYGESDKPAKGSSGTTFPTLALAVAHIVPDDETFKKMAREPSNPQLFSSDAKGFITCRSNGKVSKIFCPPLLSQLGKEWVKLEGALGRWRLQVRADGTPVGEPEFIPMPREDRLSESSRQFSNWLRNSQGPLGILYHYEIEAINKYILAAGDVWKNSSPDLTLIHTLEVVSLTGQCLGLIVLPTHPLRVAWQQSFDSLVAFSRYKENLSAAKVKSLLEKITGAHYPSFLPGLEPGKSFVFADTLGLHAVALIPADDPEPKATVSLLGRLLGGDESTAPTVGKGAAAALASEIIKYQQLHPEYRRIQIHALRAGDAMPVARALGQSILTSTDEEEHTIDDHGQQLCYELDLYPAREQTATELTGRFLSATAERHRTGAGSVPEVDRWILDSVTRPNKVSLPRLCWARRRVAVPNTPAHLSIAFDVFTSRVGFRRLSEENLSNKGVLEVHGLMLVPTREFRTTPNSHWLSFIPAILDGEKHPLTDEKNKNLNLTKRLVNLHTHILHATAKHLGGGNEDWPVLVTEVSPDQANLLQNLHELCDWVITADRNAGIEYFDSPDELPKVYESYIIDCVPQRDDLGFMQLITSTSSLDEVINLLEGTLGEMGLSASPRNCRFLLNALKAVSGRLALRLAGTGNVAQEMIAVALAHSHCMKSETDDVWLPLKEGFFIPLDDVPELFRKSKGLQGSEQRADLLYVRAKPKPVGLLLTFVEVKFRRYLKTARSMDLAKMMEEQIEASCQRWEDLFGSSTSALEKTVNRAWLARILRFYANKGKRHGLSDEAYRNAMREIDRLLLSNESDLPKLDDLNRVGFVFCPEYEGRSPDNIQHYGLAELWLFGPGLLPEQRFDEPSGKVVSLGIPIKISDLEAETLPTDKSTNQEKEELTDSFLVRQDSTFSSDPNSLSENRANVDILLGEKESDGDPVIWSVSIKSNPHLMILGLPGMGKTTCLINMCEQLQSLQITPIIFSYHQDIDEKLMTRLAEPPMVVRYAGLGFNPMQVEGNAPQGYLDNVGMLRDIFSAIFPELGDVQLGRLREALKTSYLDKGWDLGQRGEVPAFRTFLNLLRREVKPDKGLLTRLNELDDYGLFDTVTGAPTLLDMQSPTLIQIHGTQNECLQRAFSTFVLYNLYQNMFRRGPQNQITHAVIFDEAHRAAKLKLIPTMVKECRKYGIAFVLASQEAKDFDPSLFTSVASYLALRLNETDAKIMAKNFAVSDKIVHYTDRIKQMPKYKAMYYSEGMRGPIMTALADL